MSLYKNCLQYRYGTCRFFNLRKNTGSYLTESNEIGRSKFGFRLGQDRIAGRRSRLGAVGFGKRVGGEEVGFRLGSCRVVRLPVEIHQIAHRDRFMIFTHSI